jgi:DNA-binding NtrC family response regulator
MIETQPQPTILVLDDEKNIRKSIEITLSQENMNVLLAHDAALALRTLNERLVDLVIIDIQLGDIDGLTFYKKMKSEGIDVPAIFISGHATLTEAAQAIKIGGYDFVEKPFSAEKILVTVKRCLEFSSVSQKLQLLDNGGKASEIIGSSPAIKQVLLEALKVAPTNATVLITGESGSGKELLANTLHVHSGRANGPFVKVNCSAIPEALVESELFGHERGAFTDAKGFKRGLFELANRGTIFLDEVADLSLSAQAKILRVLQNGEIQKVGSEKTVKVDVRILSGTHKDLKTEVTNGRFREDLYYRLNVVPIQVPSLRERIDDIALLVGFFTKRLILKNNLTEKVVDDDVVEELKRYRWPGNIRELQNVLERMLILGGPRIVVSDLPEEILATIDTPASQGQTSALKDFRDRAEREFIIATLKRSSGNISQAALELGVGRTYLHKRLGVLAIHKKDYFS